MISTLYRCVSAVRKYRGAADHVVAFCCQLLAWRGGHVGIFFFDAPYIRFSVGIFYIESCMASTGGMGVWYPPSLSGRARIRKMVVGQGRTTPTRFFEVIQFCIDGVDLSEPTATGPLVLKVDNCFF